MKAGRLVLVAVIACLAGFAAALIGQHLLSGKQVEGTPPSAGARSDLDRLDRLPDLRLPDLQGGQVSSSQWAGRILVLNFWATWCPPCVREMPLLDQLQRESEGEGLRVVGIAIDSKEDVEQFLADNPVSFPVLLGDTGAIELSRKLGNRTQGLPFTAVFDDQGRLVYARAGELTRSALSEHLAPLLARTGR